MVKVRAAGSPAGNRVFGLTCAGARFPHFDAVNLPRLTRQL